MALEPGLPVFTPTGDIVGIVVVQMPDEDELQNMAFTGIGRDISNGLILPAAEVVKATARAKEAKSDNDDEDDEEKPTEKKKEKSADRRDTDEDSEDADTNRGAERDKKSSDDDEG
jgi:hypothetical protein